MSRVDVRDDTPPPERRDGDRVILDDGRHIARTGIAGLDRCCFQGLSLLGALFLLDDERIELAAVDGVHHMQPVERIFAIHQGRFVEIGQIFFRVLPRERSPAEQNRDVHAAGVQLFEVFFHHRNALYQQAAHADGVGLVFLRCSEDVGDWLLDAEVVNRVAVVG